MSPLGSCQAKTCAVPLLPESISIEAPFRVTRTFFTVMPARAGTGGRPAIGTPLRADWTIVWGESVPLRLVWPRIGGGACVGWSAGGV